MRSVAVAQGVVVGGDADEFDEEEEAIQRRAQEDSTTDAVVSAHLVTFASINELQVQNQKLLRITREMGAQMERGEEDALGRRRDLEKKAVEEAHELVLRLKDEVESQRAKTEAFGRERDMFRRMLAQRGEGGAGAVNGAGEGGAGAGSDAMDVDTPRLLADVQANFDAYKSEIAVDSQRLREDLKDAQQAASAARTELAKSKAQAEYTAGEFGAIHACVDWDRALTFDARHPQNASASLPRTLNSRRARWRKCPSARCSCSRAPLSKRWRLTRYVPSGLVALFSTPR